MNTNEGFSFDTIKDFDRHIDLSIPNYTNLQKAILNIATHYVSDGDTIYDLGCSTGLLLTRIKEGKAKNLTLIGVDQSQNLLGNASTSDIDFYQTDITSEDFVIEKASLVLSIFTLQFLPIHKRADLIAKVYEALPKGGAFIVAEKCYINDGYLQDLFTFSYYDLKLEHFTAKEILDKQFSLRRLMRPLSEHENRELFSRFERVHSFWQFLQFKAWLCIK